MKENITLLLKGLLAVCIRYRTYIVLGFLGLMGASTYWAFSDPIIAANIRFFAFKTAPSLIKTGFHMAVGAIAKREAKQFAITVVYLGCASCRRRTRWIKARLVVLVDYLRGWWAGMPAKWRHVATALLVTIPMFIVFCWAFGWFALLVLPFKEIWMVLRPILVWILPRVGLGQLAERVRVTERMYHLLPEKWRIIHRTLMIRHFVMPIVRHRRRLAKRVAARGVVLNGQAREQVAKARIELARKRALLLASLAKRKAARAARDTREARKKLAAQIHVVLHPWFGPNKNGIQVKWFKPWWRNKL
jgi:hypothetical protein